MTLAAQLMLVPLCLFIPLALRWGARSAAIRLMAMLGGVWLLTSWWTREASAETKSKIIGVGVLAFLAVATARGSGRGGIIGMRGRGLVDRVVGRGRGRGSSGPVVPRQGGGRVVRPRPFNAGGVTYVPVAVDRGQRAVRGVASRVGRGSRRLEVVGGTAVRNVRESRLPWRSRIGMTWINSGVWLETRLRQQRKRTVTELRADAERLEGEAGPPEYVPSWAPGGRPGWRVETDRLRRDVGRRRDR